MNTIINAPRRRLCVAFFLAVCLSPAEAQQQFAGAFHFEPVVEGVYQGTHVTHAGDGSGRLFAVTQFRDIRVVEDGELLPDAFLDIRQKVLCCSENGLLSLAFHPGYAENGRFFVTYSSPDVGDDQDALFPTVVSSFTVSDDPNVADPESEKVILEVSQPGMSHNSGRIAFGPDGMLYVA